MLGRKRAELEKHLGNGHGALYSTGVNENHRSYDNGRFQIFYTNLSLHLAEHIMFQPDNVPFSPDSPKAFGLNCPTDPASYEVKDGWRKAFLWKGTCPPYARVQVDKFKFDNIFVPASYPAVVYEISVYGGPEIAAGDRRFFQNLAFELGSEKLEMPLIMLVIGVGAFALYCLRRPIRRIGARVLLPIAEYFEPEKRKAGGFICGVSMLIGWGLWHSLSSQLANAHGEVATVLAPFYSIPYLAGIGLCMIGILTGLIIMARASDEE